MPELDITHSLESTAARVALVAIGVALAYLLAREARKIPARLAVLMATAFVDMVGMLMVLPLLPFYVKKLTGDGVVVLGASLGVGLVSGIVVTAFTVAQLVSAPFWGRFSDRFGRRPTLLVALAASAVAFVVFGFADSLPLLFLSRVVQGAGGGTVGVIQAYVADSTEPQDRAKALGWLSAATNLGVALGPVLGSWALSLGKHDLMPGDGTLVLGDATPGLLAALLCLVNIAFAARYLEESREVHVAQGPQPTPPGAATVREPSHQGEPGPREPEARAAHGPQRTPPGQAIVRVLSHPREPASRLILIYAIAIGASQGTNAVLALFLNARFRVTEHSIGYFYMYIGAISVFTRVLLLGRLVDRLGEARLSRAGIVTLACGLVCLPLAGSLVPLALAVAMIPLGTAFTFPCVTALLSRVISQADRGLYMGLQQTFGGIARIAAPLFYGWSFDALGIAVPFFFSAAFVLTTLALGVGLDRYARPHRAQNAAPDAKSPTRASGA